MRDVAALAGVGLKTVSRVVNDEPNVSSETKERVERAIDALGFEPNHGAGSLRRVGGRTQTIGLILDAVDNPFSAAINRAVEIVAAARGTAVFAASSDDDTDRERELVAAFNRRRVDGLIITAYGPDQGYLQSVRERGTPLVFVDRVPRGLLADVALTDNVALGRGRHRAPDRPRSSSDRLPGRRCGHPDRPGPAARLRAGHGRRRPRGARRLQRG